MEHAASTSLSVTILTALGAFVGALLSHFLTQRRSLDLVVYKHREEAYKILWKKTSLLPMWPRRSGVTCAQIRTLSEELRDWYFHVGGVYLSDSARHSYGDLQKALNDERRPPSPEPLTTPDYDLLQDLCSKLRTQLTYDLVSRKRMFLLSR